MEKFDAGAALVQLYTGFIYEGPALMPIATRVGSALRYCSGAGESLRWKLTRSKVIGPICCCAGGCVRGENPGIRSRLQRQVQIRDLGRQWC